MLALTAVPVLDPLTGVVWSTFSKVTAEYEIVPSGGRPDQVTTMVLPVAAAIPASSR